MYTNYITTCSIRMKLDCMGNYFLKILNIIKRINICKFWYKIYRVYTWFVQGALQVVPGRTQMRLGFVYISVPNLHLSTLYRPSVDKSSSRDKVCMVARGFTMVVPLNYM